MGGGQRGDCRPGFSLGQPRKLQQCAHSRPRVLVAAVESVPPEQYCLHTHTGPARPAVCKRIGTPALYFVKVTE